MKVKRITRPVIGLFCCWLLPHSFTPACGQQAKQPQNYREVMNINRDWKFQSGDVPGAAAPDYNDAAWTPVHIPHNFSMPYFQSAYWYTGYGWYRKYLEVPAQWKNRRLFLEFEGAFREAELFVNGKAAGTHRGGYTGFSIDITPYVTTGNNVIAVRLNNLYSPQLAPRNGDHNFTGGIYRDVHLVVTNQAHVNWYGTFVTTPQVSAKSGTVHIATEVTNHGGSNQNYTLYSQVVSPSGRVVATTTSKQSIAAASTAVFEQTTSPVKKPQLWHPQHPHLYKVISYLTAGRDTLDRYETPFGFRWLRWTADSGFFLNGSHYYFKGANVHQDHAGWASAVTNNGLLRDVRMIKDCGMDFIRGSHYPHDPSFSDACDSLGILLWEENDFWGSGGTMRESNNWFDGSGAYPARKEDQQTFEESVKMNLREMIRIHRNHPSIIAWSLCNEPFFTEGSTIGRVRTFLKELTALSHTLDPTRSVGIGGCQRGDIDKLGDIAGYNGDGARLFMNPGVPNVVTEYGSTIARRPGKYIPGWGDLQQEAYPWRSGQALWCAFDYGTRAGDFGLMGMIDYFRMPKNMWYWYRNEYRHISPPEPTEEGEASKLLLTADKHHITGTNGTDDVQLIVTVTDINGKPLSNCPAVTLSVAAGPGEFPTGSSITFQKDADIYIRDGKAAIEFRSYHGGKTIIKASSPGLTGDSIVIETSGLPLYNAAADAITERPYAREVRPQQNNTTGPTGINIAYLKPTRAGSEQPGHTANLANDNDSTTYWQAADSTGKEWWQADLENIYKLSDVQVLLPANTILPYRVEVSSDNQQWAVFHPTQQHTVRFIRVVFPEAGKTVAALREVRVYGTPSQ